MRKRIMTVCLCVGMVLAVGCGGKDSGLKVNEVVDSTEIITSTEAGIVEESTETTERAGTFLKNETSTLGRITYEGENYVWEEISITIPADWTDKYVIKEDANGVSFYQKASNEKEANMGFLCGIYRSNQYSNSGTGETLVAYTDEGMLYYLMQPTDVTCYTEDEAIMAEYAEMMTCVEWIAGSMEILAENVHYDVSQYEIPVSSILALENYHLANLTNNELWIARNEIYARHGKIFQNEYLASYFNACSWYQPKEGKTEVGERELNEVEIANLKLIVAAEEAYAKAHPYPKQYIVGEETEVSLQVNGELQNICYEVTENGDWEYACTLTIDGTEYDLNDYVTLVTPVMDVFYITDIAYYDEKLEIAILDDGPSADPVTHFFQYDGKLKYVGEVQGFPFEDYGNNQFDGFTGQNSVVGTIQLDMIESAYVDAYYWYNSNEGTIELMERVSSNYTWYDAHELYVDIPVYYSPNTDSPVLTLQAQQAVFFIATDCKEWILVRGADGVEGYIQVKDGQILNIGLPAEEVFSELYFFG
ncbi:MAG: YARHG domain-containing protein [Roseburia sp.]|nr:YARHG domain-containing protein [Roseburia sp.]